MEHLNVLLISTQDYIHHPVPSRHHYIFEELATRHEVHVPHFHVSRGQERETRLHIHNATLVPVTSPALHYALNGPFHFAVLPKIIREHAIDLVVVSHVLAGTAAIRTASRNDIPVIFDLKDWFPDSAAEYYQNTVLQKVIRNTVLGFTRYNLNHSNQIITVSPSLVDRLADNGYSSRLITNGVDTDIFKPRNTLAAKEHLGISPDTFVIGFVGSIERWFALDEVIKVLPELRKTGEEILFLVVGGGLFTDYWKEIKDLVVSLSLRDTVKFTGVVAYTELPKYIAAMDACLMPFAKWGEFALPNKFFEYSACGKPIVMSPLPDVQKIGGENLFVYHNSAELVGHLRSLMTSTPSYTIDLREFSWKKKAREFEQVFSSVLNR
jgi:glycosyltransferase involved in cell wall biosynthesis